MEKLAAYLNNHLAGAIGAVEHLDHLAHGCDDHELAAFFRNLRLEIGADQETLKKLIDQLGYRESTVRKASAWIAEKVSHVSLGRGDKMELFFSLEALVLGIIGKQKLWTALAAAAENLPQLRGFDYAQLEARACAQAAQVEARRSELARIVFRAT